MSLISPWLDFIVLLVVLFIVFYIWSVKSFYFWSQKGVKGPKPRFLSGNFGDVLIGRTMMGQRVCEIYNETKHLPFAGAYVMMKPVILINDLDLIKCVLVKDFIHFTDHFMPIDENVDPMNNHLFGLTGEKWKNLRAKLTPTFTTSKIKGMFEIISQCVTEMNNHLDKAVENDGIIDMKETLAKLNTDIIGTCAFGIDCNSFENPNSDFRKMGKKAVDPDVIGSLLMLLTAFVPSLKKFIRLSVNGPKSTEFFYNLVKNTIQYREDNNVCRNDFLQLLMQLMKDDVIDDQNSGSKEPIHGDGVRLTTMQIAAQVFVFFIAGFETSSSTSSFTLYELALNPDIQDKTRAEIDEVVAKYDNKITYDSLNEMPYLSKVLDETLRKYPPLPLLFRVCTKDYIIPETDVLIKKDTGLLISVLGIHKDEKYYPNPEKFDPERFTPENKAARNHFTHLPFGEGPRICIGNRFGLLQTKLGLVSIISNYELSVCEQTTIPMKFSSKALLMIPEKGVYLKLKKRIR